MISAIFSTDFKWKPTGRLELEEYKSMIEGEEFNSLILYTFPFPNSLSLSLSLSLKQGGNQLSSMTLNKGRPKFLHQGTLSWS
jgi:hypothetical protein